MPKVSFKSSNINIHGFTSYCSTYLIRVNQKNTVQWGSYLYIKTCNYYKLILTHSVVFFLKLLLNLRDCIRVFNNVSKKTELTCNLKNKKKSIFLSEETFLYFFCKRLLKKPKLTDEDCFLVTRKTVWHILCCSCIFPVLFTWWKLHQEGFSCYLMPKNNFLTSSFSDHAYYYLYCFPMQFDETLNFLK